MRNPDWVRDEIILAMDLYFRAGRKQLSPDHADVISLSQLLNSLPIHPHDQRDENFRNPNGISMILGNFLGVDPMHEQPGLSRNNHLQAAVWQDFVDRVPSLRQTAEAIGCFVIDRVQEADDNEELPDDNFPEGLLLTRLHRTRERNRTVVEKKKKKVLAECGRLECEVCCFDFQAAYGELGRGFAECHHTVPLAEAAFTRLTRLSDLAVVCATATGCYTVLVHP